MLNRRDLIKASAGAVVAGGVFPSHHARAQDPVRIRRDVDEMDLDDPDLKTLRTFVSTMREYPQQSLRSWTRFADVHGTPAAFNLCPHGNWYFLPWHRAYLEMYENAVRQVMSRPEFALPYWNWSLSRRVPRAFSDPKFDKRPNPLYSPFAGAVNTELRQNNLRLADSLVGTTFVERVSQAPFLVQFGGSQPVDDTGRETVLQNSLDQKWQRFKGAASELESGGHNSIHRETLGFMRTPASAQDPLFLAHHANVDRIWVNWIRSGGENSDNPLWLDMVFENHFINTDEEHYSRKVRDLLDTRALGYVYDDDNRPVRRTVRRAASTATAEQFAAMYNPADPGTAVARSRATGDYVASNLTPLSLSLKMPVGKRLDALRGMAAAQGEEQALLMLRQVKMGPDVAAINLFINLPDATPTTSVDDPHFVTRISFVGSAHGHGDADDGHHCYAVDLTPTLNRLSKSGPMKPGDFTLQVVPLLAPGAEMAEDKIELKIVDVGVL